MKTNHWMMGLIALGCLGAGCGNLEEPPSISPTCDGKVDVLPLPSNSGKTVRSDLLVKGTADHTGDLTIQRITVGGVDAKNDGFNFNTWSVTVPLALLLGLPLDENGKRTVPVVATDSCFREFPSTFEITAGLPIDAVSVSVTYPENQDYIPANGKFAATLLITASPGAAGEKVTLASTEGGTFTGAVGNQVGLNGDGKGDATGTALYTSTQAGNAFVTAKIESLTSDAQKIRVAGPPSLFPSAQTLTAKQSIRVTVDTDGSVESCQATPAKNLTAKSGSIDLMATPGATDVDNDGTIDIDITAADVIDAESTVTITCRDPFGQISNQGTYTVKP